MKNKILKIYKFLMNETTMDLSPMNIWFETDLEPDDILALYKRMKMYLEMLNISTYKLIKGSNSNKEFPADGKNSKI